MGQQLRVWVDETPKIEKFVDLPEDWDEMDEDDRADYMDDQAMKFLDKNVKFGCGVVSD